MTLDDKRNLWSVVKISQDTAKAEEQDRQKQARRALQFDQVTLQLHDNTHTLMIGCGFKAAIYSRLTLCTVYSNGYNFSVGVP